MYSIIRIQYTIHAYTVSTIVHHKSQVPYIIYSSARSFVLFLFLLLLPTKDNRLYLVSLESIRETENKRYQKAEHVCMCVRRSSVCDVSHITASRLDHHRDGQHFIPFTFNGRCSFNYKASVKRPLVLLNDWSTHVYVAGECARACF